MDVVVTSVDVSVAALRVGVEEFCLNVCDKAKIKYRTQFLLKMFTDRVKNKKMFTERVKKLKFLDFILTLTHQ